MGWLDYLLLALILGYAAWVILRPKKKDGGCCGDCGGCCGCHGKNTPPDLPES